MIWYLLFCAAQYKGSVECKAPMRMPDQATCVFVGNKMRMTADEVAYRASSRCISIKKPLETASDHRSK